MAGVPVNPLAASIPGATPTKLQEFRAKYPMYDDMSDQQLADSMHAKLYPDIDRRKFDADIGLKPYASPPDAIGRRLQNVDNNLQQAGAGLQQMTAEMGMDNLPDLFAPPEAFADNTTFQLWNAQAGRQPMAGADDPVVRQTFLMEAAAQAQPAADSAIQWRAEQEAGKIPVDAEPGSLTHYVAEAIGSTAEVAPALVLSVLSGSPIPAGIAIAAQVGGSTYGAARADGMQPEQAREYAALYAAAEAIPEAMNIGFILDTVKGGGNLFVGIAKTAASEAFQETFTEALQIGIDMGYLTTDMTWAEAGERMKDAAIMGAIAGPMMGAVATPAQKARDAVVDTWNAGAEAVKGLFGAVQQVGPDQTIPPTLRDKVNAELARKGFAPIDPNTPIVPGPNAAPKTEERLAAEPVQPVTAEQAATLPGVPAVPVTPPAAQAPAPAQPVTPDAPAAAAPVTSGGATGRIIQIESGGDPTAQNPNSSAGGLGQFIDSTWIATVRTHATELAGETDAQILARKTDGSPAGIELQTRMLDALTAENTAALTNAGIEATDGNVYAAHFLGSAGAVKVLGAADSTALADVVGAGVMEANPHLNGMTVGDFKAWTNGKMAGATPGGIRPVAGVPSVNTSTQAEPAVSQEQAETAAPALADPITTATPEMVSTPAAPVVITTPEQITAATAQVNTDPTPAQIEAGNYKKAHVSLHGFNISIESPKGSVRRGTAPDGKAWEVTMPADYGYIKRTKGADGDHVDVYIGHDPSSTDVYVVDQLDRETGKFDEHKVILGVDTLASAQMLYDAAFSDGKGRDRRAGLSKITLDQLHDWIKNGNPKKPFAKFDAKLWQNIAARRAAEEAKAPAPKEHPGLVVKNLRDGKETVIQPPGTVAPKAKPGDELANDPSFEPARQAAKGFKAGDAVEWDQNEFTPPRVGAGKIKAKQFAGFKNMGLLEVEVPTASGGTRDVTIDATKLRKAGAPIDDAAPKSANAPAAKEARTDGEPQPLAPKGADAPQGLPAGNLPEVEADRETGRASGSSGGRDGAGSERPSGDRLDGDGGLDGGPLDPDADSGGTGGRRAGQAERAKQAPPTDRSGLALTDHRIVNVEDVGAGGDKTKFDNNVKAIEIALALDGRPATAEEKAALVKWVGWGGLQTAFKRPDGSYANGWESRAKKLETILDKDQLDAARRSTLDAHYTSPEIVKAIWGAVQQLGFKTGRVLEPSVGPGNFIGLRPGNVDPQFAAVELDPITAKIAAALYQKSRVLNMGFQDFTAPDGYYDLAIGNPPFGSQKLYDEKRTHLNGFSIHNMFFAKSVDLLRPDGVLAMVVSNSFLDAVTKDKARRYIADSTEFLGAIRLPNNAFAKNAGTEVTTDIVFLRKLKADEEPTGHSWTDTAYVDDPAGGEQLPLNEYFIANPDMMLGDFGRYGSMYRPDSPALIARDGDNMADLLAAAVARLPKNVMGDRTNDVIERSRAAQVDKKVKVGSMFIDASGNVAVRNQSIAGEDQAESAELAGKALDRAKGLIGIRDILVSLRAQQLDPAADAKAMEADRKALNKAYDAFTKENGPISADANRRVFGDDPTWPQLAALEDNYDKGISAAVAARTGEKARPPTASKAAIFSKRTQAPYAAPTQAKTAKDALTSSLSVMGKIDLDYMSQLYSRPEDAVLEELAGVVFRTPSGTVETRDQYLAGNVKAKLAEAKAAALKDQTFVENVKALELVQPADVEAADIDVKPGAHWIPPKVVAAFIDHITETKGSTALYARILGVWSINVGGVSSSSSVAYGTDRVSVDKVIEAALSQKPISVYDTNGDGTRTLNRDKSEAANEKVNRVNQAWETWLFEDDARRRELVQIYNELMNTTIKREFDGSHLTLPGKIGDEIITLRPHQNNAIWRIVQGGATLLDHVVGAGKTFTMIGGAMELRRTGFAKKPMFIVPNHLVGQWAEDFLRLYPGARILAATKKDFEAKNRKKLFARIATGDWDAVIVAHSSAGRVEMDRQFQTEFLQEQLADVLAGIEEIKEAEGSTGKRSSDTVKRAERMKESIEGKLKALADTGRKDDNLTWGELGIDALFLDEAHEFKNLPYITGMGRVRGLGNPTGSQKAADLNMKVQHVMRKTGGRNVVFATGTPISNTMAEMFTIQRYLDNADMRQRGVIHFDVWARQFGQVVTDYELSPTGAYKLVSRFAKFTNMTELMQRYLSFADVVNRDDINKQLAVLGKKLPIPKMKGGKPALIVGEPSPDQTAYIAQLIKRTENMPKRPEKGADNMLKIMSDARKAALDMRLIDTAYDDYADSKPNDAVRRIKVIYDKWTPQKGTQLVFIDLSTPKGARGAEQARLKDLIERAENGDEEADQELAKISPDEIEALSSEFSVYDDMKAKLIKAGIPEAEIAFIHDANTDIQKSELFGKVNFGRVRVLFGSTAKMGAGMNANRRMVALHHIDAPWRPSDLEQREGRIIRQGNELYTADPEGFEIEINRYATERTMDASMWQTIEAKARFIEQVRKGDGARVIEDVAGEAANAAEMKAAASGNPEILEEMTLRKKLRSLESQRREHKREQAQIADTITRLIASNAYLNREIPKAAKDAKVDTAGFVIEVEGETFEKSTEGGAAVIAAVEAGLQAGKAKATFGKLYGLPMSYDTTSHGVVIVVEGARDYEFTLEAGQSPQGMMVSLKNAIAKAKGDAERMTAQIETQLTEIPKLEKKAAAWPHEADYAATEAKHRAIVARLQAPPAGAAKVEAAPAEDADVSGMDVSNANTALVPMNKHVPAFFVKGLPARPTNGKAIIGAKTVELEPLDKPTRREGVRTRLEDIIGTRLYVGKIKGQTRLGFYRKSNSEVRLKRYDDIEVMAHEMAHYLDMHYEHAARFSTKALPSNLKNEIKALSYTSDPKVYVKEGFAEYVRLWVTQYDAARQAAPAFTAHFEQKLAEDSGLQRKMLKLQEEAHKWFQQGAHAQLRAKSGEEYTASESIIRFMSSYPAETARQNAIDGIHGAKVVERTLGGKIGDATRSAYKLFQMVNGAESMHDATVRLGTPKLDADGAYSFGGDSLIKVLWPVAKHGWKRFDLLMDYFKARRAAELKGQGRENLFSGEEIRAGLALGATYPEFAQVFDAFQAFNGRMLDFYESMGLLTADMRAGFAENNKSYVPFHRITKRIEEGNSPAGASSIGKRLTGGTANIGDVAENIIEGLFTNIRAALIARAKATLYSQIMNHQDGALFAVKIGTDSKLVKVHLVAMAKKVAGVMVELGIGLSRNGVIINQPAVNGAVYELDDIADVLEKYPQALEFWMLNQPPKTDGDTFVDSAIIDGKREYFEVREPMLVDMLTGMRGLNAGTILTTFFKVRNLQTRTVTAAMQFLGPNAWRDTVSAAVLSKNKFWPIYDTLVGMGHAVANTKTFQDFRLNGGGYGTRIEAQTGETRARRALDLPSRNLWDVAAKVLTRYDSITAMFEYGSRVGEYALSIKAGKNKLEATWDGREVATDFSKAPGAAFWKGFVRTVPFMNAGIQGLDKTAQEIAAVDGKMTAANVLKLDRKKAIFVAKGSVLTAMTLILWAINNDDERYNALTDDERARFWHIWLPNGQHIQIPRPYDLGHIFASIPETMANFAKDRDGAAAASQLAWIASQSFPVGDYPGLIQPYIEVTANKTFTGAPIVPEHMKNREPRYQFTERTPMIYRMLGETLNVSPLVAEHYTAGYLRYVEDYIADATEALFWKADQWGERPFGRGIDDYLTAQFIGREVPFRTKWTEGYYDLKNRAAGMRSAFSQMQAMSIRDKAPMQAMAAEKTAMTLVALTTVFSQIDKAFEDQDAFMASVKYNPELTAAEKEGQINRYYEQKNATLATAYQQIKAALDEAEKAVSRQ